MADLNRLKQALKNADAAGDTVAARKLAAAIRAQQGSAPQTAPVAPSTAPVAPDSPRPTPEEARVARLKNISRGALDFNTAAPGARDLYSDSYTWGLMKPVNALAGAVSGELTGLFGGGAEPNATFGERWKAGTQAYDERLAEARKNAGWAGTVADIAGSLTSGRPGASIATTGRSVLPVIGQAATQGAVEGAARHSEDVTSALEGAAVGAGTGAVVSGAVGQAAKLLPGARAARATERQAARGPSGGDIRTEARGFYNKLDQAGIAYDNNQSTQLTNDLFTDLKQNGWDPGGIHASLDKILGDMQGLHGKPMSWETLANLRERVSAAAREGDPQIRRIAGRVLNQVDGFVDNNPPALSQLGQDPGPMWRNARRLWRTAGAVDDMNWRLDKAERRAASSNSGQNVENTIRQNVRGVQDRATQPGKYQPYNADELAQMSRVVEGTPVQNATRWAGNFMSGWPAQMITSAAPLAHTLATGGDPTASMLGSLATAAGTYAGGHLLKNASANMARDEADSLVRLIATGSLRPYNTAVQGPPTREALARLLLQQQAARGTANVASGRF